MASVVPDAGLSMTQSNSTISVRTDDDTVRVQYKPGETILNLKHKLHLLKGYPVDEQQLSFSGEAIVDTRLIEEFARETSPLCLNRVNMASVAGVGQSPSSHIYGRIKANNSARQCIGNIGIPPTGSSFGNHMYMDITGNGSSVQVLGDMTSFPPGFWLPQKD